MIPALARRGQSLIELIVGIGIGVLFITAAIGIITVSLRLDVQNKFSQTGGELTQQTMEQVISFANADWHNIDSLANDTPYHLTPSSGFLSSVVGSSTVTLTGAGEFETSFMTTRVYRSATTGDILDDQSGTYDPSTIKVSVATEQSGVTDRSQRVLLTHYLTRVRDRIWWQDDWSSGSSSPTTVTHPAGNTYHGPLTFSNATNTEWTSIGQLTIFDPQQNLSTTIGSGIDPAHHYAWNDVTGWIDFIFHHNISVGSAITGYAYSPAIGDIALDCATTPNGNICATPPGTGSADFGLAQAANGVITGFAWNSEVGWISFNSLNCDADVNSFIDVACGSDNASIAAPAYGVSIDGSGYFHGMAWNDAVGWISFNSSDCDTDNGGAGNGFVDVACAGDNSTVQTFTYDVKSGANQVGVGDLESVTYNTGRVGGAGLNTIMYQGPALPSGTRVLLRIATSDCSNGATNAPTCNTGTWSFLGPAGTNGNGDYYEPAGPNVPLAVTRAYANNKRYLRYRLLLLSDTSLTNGPTVYDVILNWSH